MEKVEEYCKRFAGTIKIKKSGECAPAALSKGEKTYFFLSRKPAANMATAPRSHSIRQSCTACQSSSVVAVKTKPVTIAAITQANPMTRATKEALLCPSASRNEAKSIQARTPEIAFAARLAWRSAPQT